jgi:nucleotide-binding universal stress UspA family protein
MVKDILVNLTIDAKQDPVANYAVVVAAAFDAHLTGVAFAYEPLMPGSVFGGVSASFAAKYIEEGRVAAHEARRAFEGAARSAGLIAEGHVIGASLDDASEKFGRMARGYDLSILGQARPDYSAPEELLIEATLFASGRPLLVVPYIQQAGFKLDRVMLCWDGSRKAARAIADAMPLLRLAGAIDVVTIEQIERRNELAGADIAQNLARHGLKVELKPIVAKDVDVAATILSYAADSSADFIVMGGYGHSRLREFVLGGATRGMLASTTVPTLMAH